MDCTVRKKIKRIADWSVQEARTEAVRRGDKSSLRIQSDGFYLTRGHYSNNSSATVHDAKTGKIYYVLTTNKQSAAKVLTGKGRAVEQPGQQCLGTRPLEIRHHFRCREKELFSSRDNCGCWILQQFEGTSYFLGIQAWVL